MSATFDVVTDLIRLGKEGNSSVEPTFTAGLSDSLGERLVCFAGPGSTSLELLRFKPELGDAPGFEGAIRASVEALGRLDPSLSTVQAVGRIEELGGLALVSIRETGRRLSELIPRANGTAYAVELVREIGPALALLHEAGHAHGALTPDRIIISREGHLVALEHVLGAALDGLALPADRLRAITGTAVPESAGTVRVDARLDVIQLGFIALSLVVGRRLSPSDYPGRTVALLDAFSRTDPPAAAAFRPWLERALQIAARPFGNATEALVAFRELPQMLFPKPGELPTPWPAPVQAQQAVPAPPARPPEPSRVAEPVSTLPLQAVEPARRDTGPAPMFGFSAAVDPHLTTTNLRRAVAALGVVVLVQFVVIGYLLMSGPSDAVVSGAASPVATGYQPIATAATDPPPEDGTGGPSSAGLSPQWGGAVSPAAPVTGLVPPAAAPETAPPAPGRLAIAAPVELQVFEGGALVGSSADPLTLTAGPHTLELVNEELGFRSTQAVRVAPGQSTSVTVAIPSGRININAVPWAEVWIDGVATGETPLANLSLPIGRHDILFRHPQLGERRETAVVKVDGIARVSVVFQQ